MKRWSAGSGSSARSTKQGEAGQSGALSKALHRCGRGRCSRGGASAAARRRSQAARSCSPARLALRWSVFKAGLPVGARPALHGDPAARAARQGLARRLLVLPLLLLLLRLRLLLERLLRRVPRRRVVAHRAGFRAVDVESSPPGGGSLSSCGSSGSGSRRGGWTGAAPRRPRRASGIRGSNRLELRATSASWRRAYSMSSALVGETTCSSTAWTSAACCVPTTRAFPPEGAANRPTRRRPRRNRTGIQLPGHPAAGFDRECSLQPVTRPATAASSRASSSFAVPTSR